MDTVPVTVYTREDCHLCEEAIETIERVAETVSVDIDLSITDVDDDPRLRSKYGDRVPYVLVDGRPAFKYRVDAEQLRESLLERAE